MCIKVDMGYKTASTGGTAPQTVIPQRQKMWLQDKMWAVSGIVSGMKKSPKGDLFTGSGSSNRRRWLFAQCVIHLQKSLLQNVVCAESLHKQKKNKLDKVVEGCKKASGYWITNLTSVMGDLCKLSGPETILERHCCELCAVLTVLPTPLLLDRVSFLWLPIGIWCYVPVPLLTHDFHPNYLFLKLTDLALQLNSALNIFFTLKSVRTILSENTFWLPVEHSEKDEPLDRLASHINSKYYWFWELNFPWEVWISSSIMVWLSNRWFISY